MLVVLGAATLAALPAAALGQGAIDVRLHAFGSSLNGVGPVPNAPVLDDPAAVLSYTDFGAALAAGLGLELRVSALPVGVRVTGARSVGITETGIWGCGVDGNGSPVPCPSILIEVPTDVTASVLTAALVGDLRAGRVTFHPMVGVGVQRWSYRWDSSAVGSFSLEPGAFADDAAALYLGLASSVRAGRARLEVGYGEHRSESGRARPGRTRSWTVGSSLDLG